MSHVLQIKWRRIQHRHGTALTSDHLFGQYIVDYDPTVDEDQCYSLTAATHIEEARAFPTREAAEAYRDRAAPNVLHRPNIGSDARPLLGPTAGKADFQPLTTDYWVDVKER
jgi:hypothetical protein